MKGELAIKFLIIIILLLGLCYNIAFIFSFERIYPQNAEIDVIAEVISIKIEKEYYDKYIVKIIYNPKIQEAKNTRLLLYVDKEKELLPGDIVKITGSFEKASESRNYNGFNYDTYLRQSKIYGIVKADDVKIVKNQLDFYSIIGKIRLKLSKQLELLYDEKSENFLNGMLLGILDSLDNEIKEDFKNSNLSHILAISGSHLVYVIVVFKIILDKIIRSKKIKNIFLIIILFFFTMVTGGAVSCIRAFIMSSMILISSNVHRKNNFYISFIFSLFIILIINPYNIFNIGMWLSFAGTVGIVMFYNFFDKIMSRKIKNKIIKYFSKLSLVTISAQILIFPIIIYSFNIVSLTFVISNIFVSFFVGPVLIIGYISIFISFFIPKIKFIVFIENILIKLILIIAKVCGKLPFSKIYVCTPNFIMILLYYISIFGFAYFCSNRKLYALKLFISLKFLKSEFVRIFKSKLIKKIFIIFIIGNLIINFIKIENNLKVHFLDVGQGDCTFIITPSGKNVIIDGGEGEESGYDYGANVILPYLLDKGIKKIDFMIISHCDSDHIGGLFTILKEIKVKKVVIGIQPENSENLNTLINICVKKKIEIIVLEAGEKLNIDKKIYLDTIWPEKGNLINENTLNNNSLVFKFVYNEFSMLFTGDIESIAEKELLKKYQNTTRLNSTILKVAHHGSATSTIQEFLDFIAPKIALIGVGKDNKYGHPSESIIKRLKNMRCFNLSD